MQRRPLGGASNGVAESKNDRDAELFGRRTMRLGKFMMRLITDAGPTDVMRHSAQWGGDLARSAERHPGRAARARSECVDGGVGASREGGMGASAALSTRQARRCEPLRAVSRCWERDRPQRRAFSTRRNRRISRVAGRREGDLSGDWRSARA